MSEFEVKKNQNNVLKNWESEKIVSLQGLTSVATSLPCKKVVADLWSQPLKLFQA